LQGATLTVPKLFGLREAREAQFLTQGELAERSGVSRQTINRIEQGEIEPRFKTIRRLATALGVEPRELVEGGNQ
jgi:transcriptional regulator with XRE-family HTH domain